MLLAWTRCCSMNMLWIVQLTGENTKNIIQMMWNNYNITCVQSLSLPQNSYQAIVVPILMSIKVHFRSLFTFSQSSSISICCNLSSSMLIFLLSCFVRRLWSLLSCSLSALTYDERWQRCYPFTLKWNNLLVQGVALYTRPQPDLYSDKYSIITDAFADDIL